MGLGPVVELSVLSQWGSERFKIWPPSCVKKGSFRIQRELQGGTLATPTPLIGSIATAFRMGDLDVLTASRGETMLFQADADLSQHCFCVLRLVPGRGGIFRHHSPSRDTGELQLSYGNLSNKFLRENYSLDVRGNRLHWLSQSTQTYDARTRPWFHRAISAESPVWTDVYLAFSTRFTHRNGPVCPSTIIRTGSCWAFALPMWVLPEEFRSFLSQFTHRSVGAGLLW